MNDERDNWKAAFPKPTWEAEDVLLYHADCLDILPQIPDGAVDAVVTDPPYRGLRGGHRRDFPGGVTKRNSVSYSMGDRWSATHEWAPHARRVGCRGAIVFCSFHSVCDWPALFAPCKMMALGTWFKRNSPPTGKNLPRYTNEHLWFLKWRPGLKWDSYDTTVFDVPMLCGGCMASGEFVAEHPTQKPLALMRRLLTIAPRSVCDPFLGSGTTGVACAQKGQPFVGIEIDKDYFAIAVKRIEAAIRDEAGKFPTMRAKPVEQPELPLCPKLPSSSGG